MFINTAKTSGTTHFWEKHCKAVDFGHAVADKIAKKVSSLSFFVALILLR